MPYPKQNIATLDLYRVITFPVFVVYLTPDFSRSIEERNA